MPVTCSICRKDLRFPSKKIGCDYCSRVHCSTCSVRVDSRYYCLHCYKLQNGNFEIVFLKAVPKHVLLMHIKKQGITYKHPAEKDDLAYAILCHHIEGMKRNLRTAEASVPSYWQHDPPPSSSRQRYQQASALFPPQVHTPSSADLGFSQEAANLLPSRDMDMSHAGHRVVVGAPSLLQDAPLLTTPSAVVPVATASSISSSVTRDTSTQTVESSLGTSMPNLTLAEQMYSPYSSKGDLYVEKTFDPSTIPTLNDIDHEEDMKKLSIRQLKTILVRNFVDIRSCVERKELVERLERLWKSRKMEQERLAMVSGTVIQDEYVCKICMDAPVDCVFLDCGHLVTCVSCGKQMNECPICRQYVVRVVHTFRV